MSITIHKGSTHRFTNYSEGTQVTLQAGAGESLSIQGLSSVSATSGSATNFLMTNASISNVFITTGTVTQLSVGGQAVANLAVTSGTFANALITSDLIGGQISNVFRAASVSGTTASPVVFASSNSSEGNSVITNSSGFFNITKSGYYMFTLDSILLSASVGYAATVTMQEDPLSDSTWSSIDNYTITTNADVNSRSSRTFVTVQSLLAGSRVRFNSSIAGGNLDIYMNIVRLAPL